MRTRSDCVNGGNDKEAAADSYFGSLVYLTLDAMLYMLHLPPFNIAFVIAAHHNSFMVIPATQADVDIDFPISLERFATSSTSLKTPDFSDKLALISVVYFGCRQFVRSRRSYG